MNRDFIADSSEEQAGVNFKYSEKYKQLLGDSIEIRNHKGLVGSTVMHWAPTQVIHQRNNISDAEFKKFQHIQDYKTK